MERPSKIYPNWYFWPENMSSGNPGWHQSLARALSLQASFSISARIKVARWFVFKPKIQIWVNFGGSCDGIC
jgi:hypothetical protein